MNVTQNAEFTFSSFFPQCFQKPSPVRVVKTLPHNKLLNFTECRYITYRLSLKWWKILWKKDKMLVTSILSFYPIRIVNTRGCVVITESCFRHPLFDLRGTRKVEIRHTNFMADFRRRM